MGGYGTLKLFVNDNTGIYEGSTLSTVAIAIIPLIWWAIEATIGMNTEIGRSLTDVAAGEPVAAWKVPGETAIPSGRYRVTITPSARFKRELPLLNRVAGFEGAEAAVRAEVLAAAGAQVEIMTPDRSFAPEVMAMTLVPYMRSLQKLDVTFTVTYRLQSVERTASLEAAHPLLKRMPNLLGAVFVDAGDAAERFGKLRPHVGYGVGLRWLSPVGPLRLDVAFGDGLDRWRLHFSVGVSRPIAAAASAASIRPRLTLAS